MGRTLHEPRLVRIEGRRKWYIRWTEQGRSVVRSTGTEDRRTAERFLTRYLAALHDGDKPTISQILDRYLEARRHLASHSRYLDFAKRPKAEWGDLWPEDIDDLRVGRYIAKHGERTMTRRELELVSSAIGRRLPLPNRKPPRERYLTREEGEKLHQAARSHHMRLFILLALTTGRRSGAILDLTWDRVDLDRGILDFRNPERGETRKRRGLCRVPAHVVAALRDAKQFARTEGVIEYQGRRVRKLWHGVKRTAKRAGTPWAHPHLLKHSLISWLAEDGLTVDQIADFTDTTRETVWRIYRKVNPASQQAVVDVIGGYLAHGVVRNEASERPKTSRNPRKAVVG